MKTLNHAHQENLFDPRNAGRVIIIGAGSVGSWLTEFLARMGVAELEVWDDDAVASHNVPMSCYRPQDISRYKVDALREIVLERTGVAITAHRERYTGQTSLRGACVISCVDTMESRRCIWERVKQERVSIGLFCDTRIGDAYVEVYSIEPHTKKDADRYDQTLFPDEEAKRQICGMHGIVFASSRAAGIVAANLAAFWTTGTKRWIVQERCDSLQQVLSS